MRCLRLTFASISIVLAAPALAMGSTFSVDFQGPMIGVPDSFVGAPITEGDILTVGLPGPLGPNPPLPGIGVFPPGTMVGAFPGAPGIFPGGLGILPGIFGCVEVDALSYGFDVILPESVIVFSVDEFAGGDGLLIAPPDVNTEGIFGAAEASADVFEYLGPVVPTPPGPPLGNTAFIDGDGIAPPAGVPGVGLIEPNPPTPGFIPDPGDNLDALDVDTLPADPGGPIYFSLDSFFPDPLEPFPVNCGTAVGNGFSGADVLVSFPFGFPAVAIPAFMLGLDFFGFDTDDLDALSWDDADGTGTLTPPDTIFFSVRRGSAVIGAPDSAFGVPIEEGDILTVPAFLTPFPAIFIAAEALGLGTLRSGTAGFFGPFGDDLDALDDPVLVPEPGFGLQLAVGLVFLATVGRRRMKD